MGLPERMLLEVRGHLGVVQYAFSAGRQWGVRDTQSKYAEMPKSNVQQMLLVKYPECGSKITQMSILYCATVIPVMQNNFPGSSQLSNTFDYYSAR